MKLPKLETKNLRKLLSHFGRDEFIILGVIILALFLAALIIFDAYFFYTSLKAEKEVVQAPHKITTLTSVEIDEAIKVLDERQQEFNRILGR